MDDTTLETIERELIRLDLKSQTTGLTLDDMRIIALAHETKEKLLGTDSLNIRLTDDRTVKAARNLTSEELTLALKTLAKEAESDD